MQFNSWKYLGFDKSKFKCIYSPKENNVIFSLIIGANVIAKTRYFYESGNLLIPHFFLNSFDIPVTEYHVISLKIEENNETQLIKQKDLLFQQGHHSTKRNPTKDILLEFYDKSFETQVDRNILRFTGGLCGIVYIPGLTNHLLFDSYLKMLNTVKYKKIEFNDVKLTKGSDIQFQLPIYENKSEFDYTNSKKFIFGDGKIYFNEIYCNEKI